MTPAFFFRASRARRQRGVVLLFCLIVLVILLIGGVAVMRSTQTSLASAGNLAFRRDLSSQGEQAASNVLTAFKSGVLKTATLSAASISSANYSAVELTANDQGIPLVLLSSSSSPSGTDFTGTTFSPTASDLTGATSDITIRYVIDRLCRAAGTATTSTCVYSPSSSDVTGGSSQLPASQRPASSISPVYRLSVRVTGTRSTQVFLQTSFTRPE
ncbi:MULTISPECIES: pilus assembly PilX family protein [unclassified Variovorax]|uniref:pilus assembly PilX family protein n=1 Tax=unclassified Variovorax TaxID=663243 RepID=UPI003F478B1A